MTTVLAVVVGIMPQFSAPNELAMLPLPIEASIANDFLREVAEELEGEYTGQGGRLQIDRTPDQAKIGAMNWESFALSADWDVIETVHDYGIIGIRWAASGDGTSCEVLQWRPINTSRTYAVTGDSRDQIGPITALLVEQAGL